MDPYEVLGVGRDISQEDLRKVFLRLAKQLHPDTARTDEEKHEKEMRFKEITQAYNMLKSKEFSRGLDDRKHPESDSRETLVRKAHVYISKGDYNSALKTLNLIKCDVDEGYEINLLYGIALLKKQRYHQAIKHFQKAVKSNPWDIEGYLYLGEVYEAILLKESAKKFYQEALKIDTSNKKANEALERLSSNTIGSLFRKIFGKR